MADIDTNAYITIFISLIALTIAILGYLDNRKNIKIVRERENEKNEIRNVLNELKKTSDTLKKLPEHCRLGLMYFAISDISKEVYENETLNLKFEFQAIQTSKFSIDANSITAESLRNLIKKIIDTQKRENYYESPTINFIDNPDVISNKWFELDEITYIFEKIEDNISKLDDFEYLIDSFDAEILKMIEKHYVKILELLADGFHKKSYTFELNRNMKPSEIEDEIGKIFNYEKITEQSMHLSTVVASRIDELRKDLSKQILT